MGEDKKENIKENRIRAITKLYYSNPKVQQVLAEFSKNREVVPRYFEGFGKRPDTIQYVSDIISLVNKGATSFHASEELWNDSLSLTTDMNQEQLNTLRKSWDLLIDIDSPYLDFSKIVAKLLLEELENYGIKSYGIKFSGSKGFHIIVPSNSFPEEFQGKKTKDMFPEWPRAICEFLMNKITPEFNRQNRSITNIGALEIRTNKERKELMNVVCPECGKELKQDKLITFQCDYCSTEIKQKFSVIARKRVMRCERCLSELNKIEEEEFFECKDCRISNIARLKEDDSKNIKYTKDAREENIQEMTQKIHDKYTGGFDLVLVAPRHLFRMPYSLHEKTALASVVLKKEELKNFTPGDANPLKLTIREYRPEGIVNEAMKLLADSIAWKKQKMKEIEDKENRRYGGKSFENGKEFKNIEIKDVQEREFPESIKKLLKGLEDGKKRGLFILITFLRCINYTPEQINNVITLWNKKNTPPLKEGYIRSQIDWHLKQKRKILPPNYSNESFYKDLKLIDKKPEVKNPLVEVVRKIRKRDKNV